MKIRMYFKGKDIPNVVYNLFGQGVATVDDIRVNGGFVIVDKSANKQVVINKDIIASFEIDSE